MIDNRKGLEKYILKIQLFVWRETAVDRKNSIRKRNGKREANIRKVNMYKDAAVNAMENVSEFDSKIIDANDGYLERLVQADKPEYDILSRNLELAETAEERNAIRGRMAEMKKERYEKDTENKEFYKDQQANHKNYTLQVLVSVAAVTSVVYKFRKPLMEAGKKLITQKQGL